MYILCGLLQEKGREISVKSSLGCTDGGVPTAKCQLPPTLGMLEPPAVP